ncbi:MAG TPA: hypothetical protein VEI96_01635 [Thermodesulfovibrionales bacterium]|nr:hypothetical protein [Thermodesulfovibrionales bacterium]
MRLMPLHDWVLIRRKEPEGKTAGGIIIPDSVRDTPDEGIVEAVGPGRFKKEPGKRGERFEATVVKPGQRVFFSGYAARDVVLQEEKVTLIREADILGVLEGTGEVTVKKPFQVEVKTGQPLLVPKKTGPAVRKIPTTKVPVAARKPRAESPAKAKETRKTKKADAVKTASGRAEKKIAPAKRTRITEKKKTRKTTVASPKPGKKAPARKTTSKSSAQQTLLKRRVQKKGTAKKTVSPKKKAGVSRESKGGVKAKRSSRK